MLSINGMIECKARNEPPIKFERRVMSKRLFIAGRDKRISKHKDKAHFGDSRFLLTFAKTK